MPGVRFCVPGALLTLLQLGRLLRACRSVKEAGDGPPDDPGREDRFIAPGIRSHERFDIDENTPDVRAGLSLRTRVSAHGCLHGRRHAAPQSVRKAQAVSELRRPGIHVVQAQLRITAAEPRFGVIADVVCTRPPNGPCWAMIVQTARATRCRMPGTGDVPNERTLHSARTR